MTCSICSGEIEVQVHGWDKGHNAYPITDGRCCSDCNHLVVQARITGQLPSYRKRKSLLKK